MTGIGLEMWKQVPFKVRVLRIHKMTCLSLGPAAWVKTKLVHGLLVLSCSPNARKDANLLGKLKNKRENWNALWQE